MKKSLDIVFHPTNINKSPVPALMTYTENFNPVVRTEGLVVQVKKPIYVIAK